MVDSIIAYFQTDEATRPHAPKMTELHNLIAAMSAEFRYTWHKSYKFTVEIESECGSLVVDG